MNMSWKDRIELLDYLLTQTRAMLDALSESDVERLAAIVDQRHDAVKYLEHLQETECAPSTDSRSAGQAVEFEEKLARLAVLDRQCHELAVSLHLHLEQQLGQVRSRRRVVGGYGKTAHSCASPGSGRLRGKA